MGANESLTVYHPPAQGDTGRQPPEHLQDGEL